MKLSEIAKVVGGTMSTVIFLVLVFAPIVGQNDDPMIKVVWHQWDYWALVTSSGGFAAIFWWGEYQTHTRKDPQRL